MSDLTREELTKRARKSKRKGANYCACGCGTEIPLISKRHEPQVFAWGHNTRINLYEHYVVEDRGYFTPCWIWQGGTNHNGYGRASVSGRNQPAHRIFYERAGGVVPAGWQVDHLCFVPLCVNPTHLEAVTAVENVRRSRSTKLTAEDVAAIRKVREDALAANPINTLGQPRVRVPNGNAIRAELAQKYGVHTDYIKVIWRGEAWA